jgi:hypothetical protein
MRDAVSATADQAAPPGGTAPDLFPLAPLDRYVGSAIL